MLRLVQWMKFLTLTFIPFAHIAGLIELKTGEPFIIGVVLMVCEFINVILELLTLMKTLDSTSTGGIFVTTFIAFMVSAMVAAQLINIREINLLFVSSGVSIVFALLIAVCVPEPENLDWIFALLGFGAGLGIAVAFEGTHDFKQQDELAAYGVLFGFNFILPFLKYKYDKAVIPPEYERSYHRDPLLQCQV